MPDDDHKALNATAAPVADATREAHYQQAIREALILGKEVNVTEEPTRFSLFELMVVVTMLAVMLGLIRSLGMWGAVLNFIGAVVWTQWIYPRWHGDSRTKPTTMFDCVWGLIMPVVCLLGDPFIFKDQPDLINGAFDVRQFAQFQPRLRKESLAVYVLIGWQMSTLLLWIVGRPWLARIAGLFFGTWVVGVIFAGVLGILLFPLAAIGSVVGVGLLGFTPLFTTYAIARRLRETIDDGVLDASDRSVPVFWLLTGFGFMGAWVIPLYASSWIGKLIGA
jgi:hypothetical protein